jgi:hypothetical protein
MIKLLLTLVAYLGIAARVATAQGVEWSIPAPCDDISGMGQFGYSEDLLVLDSLQSMIYRVDHWDGEVLDTFFLPYIPNPPVGLACKGDTIYFAEGGTAVVHGMILDGPTIGMWDFADSGIASISGLGWWHQDAEWLYVADVAQNLVFRTTLDDWFATVEIYLDLVDCPEIHDIGGVGGYQTLPVACEDTQSPVRLYYPDGSFEVLGIGYYDSAVGVARIMHNRFYFSDPGIVEIHRYCEDMGGVQDEPSDLPVNPLLSASPNPSTGALTLSFCIPSQANVRISLYDLSGRVTGVLVDSAFPGGASSVQVDCAGIPAGTYVVSLRSGALAARHPILLLQE